MWKSLWILCLMLPSLAGWTQTATDALRYSMLDLGGSARTLGVSGSLEALGADFGAMTLNPAGLAAFRRSEFTFSPALFFSTTTSQLSGADNAVYERQRTHFGFEQAGFVFASRPYASRWKTVNFGIGVVRRGNYRQRFYYEGRSEGSYTDRFVELADGLTPDQLDGFEAGLAYEVGAIFNPDPNDETTYINDIPAGTLVPKRQQVTTGGGMSEMFFSFAGNYDEKLLIGATVGVPFIFYTETKLYEEEDVNDEIPTFDRFEFEERLTTRGTGVNLRLGLIYRASQAARFGFAFQTPTLFALEDSYKTRMAYAFTLGGPNSFEGESPDGLFEYRLRTPMRASLSAGYLFDKTGFVSAAVEWVDYATATFEFNRTSNPDDLQYEAQLNDQVSEQYTSAVNFRAGAEWAADIFRLRGGINLATSPYVDDDSFTLGYSLGAGIRERGVFVDLAWRATAFSEGYRPYQTAVAPRSLVQNDVRNQEFILTFGFKF